MPQWRRAQASCLQVSAAAAWCRACMAACGLQWCLGRHAWRSCHLRRGGGEVRLQSRGAEPGCSQGGAVHEPARGAL